MRILLTMNLPFARSHGGTNRSNRALATELASRGHQVRVVVPALASPSRITHEQLLAELALEGIEVRTGDGVDRFQTHGVSVYAVIDPTQLRAQLKQHVSDFAPDWIFVSAEDPSQNLLSAALELAPQRVVYLAHTPQLFPFGPLSLYPSELRTGLVRRARVIVCISEFVADYVKRWAAVEPLLCHPPHFGRGPWPQLAKFDRGRVLLMNASRIKGLSIFLELARRNPELPFAALPGYATTSQDLSELRELDNVELWRNEPSLDDIFQRTRVLLMPTLWAEGFGMAALDAQLRGIPVLAADHAGLIEAVPEPRARIVIAPIERFTSEPDENLLPVPELPVQHVEPWQRALETLVHDREYYEALSMAAATSARAFAENLTIDPLLQHLARLDSEQVIRSAPELPRAARPSFARRLRSLPVQARQRLWDKLRTEARAAPAPEPSGLLQGPLSHAQERMCFLHELAPLDGAYNIPVHFRLQGALDLEACLRSLRTLQERHAILRTRLSRVDGQLMQEVAAACEVPYSFEDLAAQEGSEELVQARSREQATRAFDLFAAPAWRVRVLRSAPDQHVVLLTLHHIVADGWSLSVLARDWLAAYEAACAGRAPTLAPLSLQYVDFAARERRAPADGRALAYWCEQLCAPLPAPRLLGAAAQRAGDVVSFELVPQLANQLRGFARDARTTPFVVLLAAFQLLLQRVCGTQDVIVGVPIANRTNTELEALIGVFVNTLAMRARFEEVPDFRALVEQVRATAAHAQQHQSLPFDVLGRALQAAGTLREGAALFETMFVYDDGELDARVGPFAITPLAAHSSTAKFALTLSVANAGERGMRAALEFAHAALTSEQAKALTQSYVALLDEVLRDSTKPLAVLQTPVPVVTASVPAREEPPRPAVVVPRLILERALVRVIARLLPGTAIDLHQNFFDVGVHSLLLLELREQLQGELGLAIPLVDFFHHPTIASLAEHLGAGREPTAAALEDDDAVATRRARARDMRRRRQVSEEQGS